MSDTDTNATTATIELLIGGDLDEVGYQPLNEGEVAYYTLSSPDKDTGNEDNIGVVQIHGDTTALMVADGLGGTALAPKRRLLPLSRCLTVCATTARSARCAPL